jgi:hypothetical protein
MILTLMFIFSGCAAHREMLKNPVKPESQREAVKPGYWLDEETGTVHKFEIVDGVEKVVSITKYKNGEPLEVMKILSSDNKNGNFHWSYFVPSTLYAVEFTALSAGENEISIEWKNRSAEGDEDSGIDRLVRCDETGSAITEKDHSVEDSDLQDEFSSFENN